MCIETHEAPVSGGRVRVTVVHMDKAVIVATSELEKVGPACRRGITYPCALRSFLMGRKLICRSIAAGRLQIFLLSAA